MSVIFSTQIFSLVTRKQLPPPQLKTFALEVLKNLKKNNFPNFFSEIKPFTCEKAVAKTRAENFLG